MALTERIHALGDHARSRRKREEKLTGEDDAAERAVIHEWENWAALHSDDLNSPGASMFFFAHLQEKKPELLNFHSDDKWETVHDWLLREGCVAD